MALNNIQIETVLDGLHEPVFILNEERNIVYMNAAAETLFGGGFTGMDFVRIIRDHECLSLVAGLLAGKQQFQKAISIEHPFKATFLFKGCPIAQLDDGKTGFLVSLKDMTDLKNAEQMRSDFVANVSHELRSPLTSLAGFIETLKTSAKDDPLARKRFLGLMEKESARMVRLISDLLSLSKVEANIRVRPEGKVDVGALVQRVAVTLESKAKAEGKTIDMDVDNKLTPIRGNEDEIAQIVINLMENAIKYGARDSVVSVSVKQSQGLAGIKGNALSIVVSDQGEGIEAEHIPRLTERFYRVDAHRSRDKGGTGLGLAIVKHIVNHHLGRLQITSVRGKGSTFSVHLPM